MEIVKTHIHIQLYLISLVRFGWQGLYPVHQCESMSPPAWDMCIGAQRFTPGRSPLVASKCLSASTMFLMLELLMMFGWSTFRKILRMDLHGYQIEHGIAPQQRNARHVSTHQISSDLWATRWAACFEFCFRCVICTAVKLVASNLPDFHYRENKSASLV